MGALQSTCCWGRRERCATCYPASARSWGGVFPGVILVYLALRHGPVFLLPAQLIFLHILLAALGSASGFLIHYRRRRARPTADDLLGFFVLSTAFGLAGFALLFAIITRTWATGWSPRPPPPLAPPLTRGQGGRVLLLARVLGVPVLEGERGKAGLDEADVPPGTARGQAGAVMPPPGTASAGRRDRKRGAALNKSVRPAKIAYLDRCRRSCGRFRISS